ncbi:uncharacterized protein LOC135109441 [Scylla paramamosain]|uniref:uncharacterized protein LOC135109441 n=1 Tax=Scylla paramamosain TaxID=85552 RepID=UPI003082C5E5
MHPVRNCRDEGRGVREGMLLAETTTPVVEELASSSSSSSSSHTVQSTGGDWCRAMSWMATWGLSQLSRRGHPILKAGRDSCRPPVTTSFYLPHHSLLPPP